MKRWERSGKMPGPDLDPASAHSLLRLAVQNLLLLALKLVIGQGTSVV